MAELAEKYRDRARERRDGANPDYTNVETARNASSAAYRAVAPDVKSGIDAAERRKQMIQESKFLGGDMEHTHLVKGLDYALLQKVRSEIVVKELEEEDEPEEAEEKKPEEEPAKEIKAPPPKPEKKELEFQTVMGKNIFNTVAARRSRHVERNELFAPGRMAYVIDLAEDENAESDIPTTLIRSKADVPSSAEDIQTLTTNDIVINKLAQILSYLRQGGRSKKNKRRDKDKPLFKEDDDMKPPGNSGVSGGGGSSGSRHRKETHEDDSIYGNIGDYVPSRASGGSGEYGGGSSRHRGEKSKSLAEYEKSRAGEGGSGSSTTKGYFGKNEEEEIKERDIPPPPRISAFISKITAEPEGYAECYPGLEEMNDAIDDSDDEVDYTKMDLGNKKGPVGRWDFDTQEEYSDYMSTKEALPKAAFQYGVKMQDGRKTRKHKTEKNEKAELDREWQKIQNIIHKRKAGGGGGGGGGSAGGGNDEPATKSAKY